MSPEVIQFIKENKNLIDENSKESWEEIYKKLTKKNCIGEFTEIMLSIDVDPVKNLSYIPTKYLFESQISTYSIPDNITSIGSRAFYGCKNLTHFKIPNNVKSINSQIFEHCGNLLNVEIGNNVKYISDYMFCGCTRLTNIIVPDNVSIIGDCAFFGCSSLTNVEIPNTLTDIGYFVFHSCKNLKSINYKGTMEEAIKCGIGDNSRSRWRDGSSLQKIICLDGEITLFKK